MFSCIDFLLFTGKNEIGPVFFPEEKLNKLHPNQNHSAPLNLNIRKFILNSTRLFCIVCTYTTRLLPILFLGVAIIHE